jgi:chorismate mutase
VIYLYCVRGAITINNNAKEEIYTSTQRLIKEIMKRNNLSIDDFVSIIFSCTNDITKAYPGPAARELGFKYTPIMCLSEMEVEHSLNKCIRILAFIDGCLDKRNVKHVYLGEANVLRQDLVDEDTTI